MEIVKIKKNILVFRYNKKNDQPNCTYIYGTSKAILIDAGPSRSFSEEVIKYLKENSLRLPDYVLITHYHWDHSFGLIGYTAESFGSKYTNERLIALKTIDFSKDDYISDTLINKFSEVHLALEYPNLKNIEIKTIDTIIDNEKQLDLGDCFVTIIPIISSHTNGSLIALCEDILIIGDSACPELIECEFIENYELLGSFYKQISKLKYNYVINGHSDVYKRDDFLDEIYRTLEEKQ